jgi:L-iditol 2-dehydrogenase
MARRRWLKRFRLLWQGAKGLIGLGSCVLITGGGLVGLFAVQVAKTLGATEVVLVEPQEGRRKLPMSWGLKR